ncbi:MAG: hypothetical protein GC168_18985 [Candidatus Hydrogenedens sp.]|nr:hypothetical protein [Candidatus Hydrogenedens sp.]
MRTLICSGAILIAALAASARDLVVDAAAGCVKKEGESDLVYCTIQEAIDAAFAEGGGDVIVKQGVYRENLVLREDVKVEGDELGVVIEFPGGPLPEALVMTANHSALHKVTLRIPEGAEAGIPLLKISGVEEVEMEDVVFDGGFNRGSIGILVQNQFLETSQVVKATLRRLEVGILAEDTRFRITRCLFEDILRDAIYVRPPSVKDSGEFEKPEIGDEEDLEFSGFNRFRNIGGFLDAENNPINEGDAFLLRNTTGNDLVAQLNDWGIYDAGDIANGFSSAEPGSGKTAKGLSPVVFEPYLGKSIFPGSVFVRIRDSVTKTALENADPRLKLNAIDTGIDPGFDAVSKLYSFTFINPNTYSVFAQAPAYVSASKPAVVAASAIVAMDIPLVSDGTAEGEPVDSPHSADQNADGMLGLSELLRVVQLFNGTAYFCDGGSEDGFSLSGGDRQCAPHAADYKPQDWVISLSETLRSVQFFNSGGYYACTGSEDGYCPGAPPA